MHDIDDPRNLIDRRVVESPELLGRECRGCMRILPYVFFQRDSSYRDGRRDLCDNCASTPQLSTLEHSIRLREMNNASHALKAQRPAHQDDYRNEGARRGRPMHHSEFLLQLSRLIPNLYVTEGRILGDLAVYRTYPGPQSRFEGRDFEYLWYLPEGWMPEFSQWEFDNRDVLVREKRRGWRTPLLRLIKAGLLSEETCNRVFGRAYLGPASTVWFRELWKYRNRKAA